MKVSDKDLGLVLRAAEAHFAAHGSLTSAVVEAIEALPDARPGPMPSRHQLAAELAALGEGSAWHGWAKLGGDLQNAYLKEADHAIARCAAGKLPAEAWRLVEAWHEAAACDDDACIAYDLAANKLEAALKSAPGADRIAELEAEVERWRQRHADVEEQLRSAVAQGVVAEFPAGEVAASALNEGRIADAIRVALSTPYGTNTRVEDLHTAIHAELGCNANKRIADLESQLASVTKERDCLRDPNDPHNDARRFEARLQQEIADGKRLVRERDEALAKLAALREDFTATNGQLARAYEELQSALSELAARPEPVVVDEAFERRLGLALHECVGCEDPLRAALRQVLGDRASVSVPPPIDRQLATNILSAYEARRRDPDVCNVERPAVSLQQVLTGWLYARGLASWTAPRGEDDAAYIERVQQERHKWQEMRNADCDRANAAERECDQLRADLAKLRELTARTDPCEEYVLQLRRIADAVGSDVAIDEVDVVAISKLAELRADLAKANVEIIAYKQCVDDARRLLDARKDEPTTMARYMAEVDPLRAQIEKLSADLAACRVERDHWLAEHGRVTAELEACRHAFDDAVTACGRAQEKYDALGEASGKAAEKLYWVSDDIFRSVHANPGERLMYNIDAARALLKPATPEPQPVPWADRASPTDEERARLGVPLQQPPTWLKPVLDDAQSRHVDVSDHAQRQIDGIRAEAVQARLDKLEALALRAVTKADMALKALDAGSKP